MNRPGRILIVDDEPLMRDALTFKLTGEGYIVETAEDGEKAMERLDLMDYDIIISDIMMPYISGLELLKILKERGTAAPVLMLTSLHSSVAETKALEMGAADYLTKPFDPKELCFKVKKLLKKNNL